MTAVEWFVKESEGINRTQVEWHETFNKAKEMEKEQIVTAYYQGYRNDIGTTEVAEKYYNETFK